MIRPIALVGIDNTIANTSWRERASDWEEYNTNSKNDKAIPGIVDMLLALHLDNWRLVGFTSRNEKWRKVTMEWLLKNEALLDELLMRADGEYANAPEVKLAMAQKRFSEKLTDVRLVIDDREDVLAGFNALGITTMLVHGGA